MHLMAIAGIAVILFSVSVLAIALSAITRFRRELRFQGVKEIPILRAQVVVVGIWTATLVAGIIILAVGT